VKSKDSNYKTYFAPLAVLCVMVFIFVYSTLPSLRMNNYLNRVKNKRVEDISILQKAENRINRLNQALDNDPTTIEKHLRLRFSHARGAGEVEIDTEVR